MRTLTDYRPGDPVFMSGTRLDVAAIAGDRLVLKQFHSKPPAWPLLDLPFSFVADLFFWMLPRTAAPQTRLNSDRNAEISLGHVHERPLDNRS